MKSPGLTIQIGDKCTDVHVGRVLEVIKILSDGAFTCQLIRATPYYAKWSGYGFEIHIYRKGAPPP